MRFVSILPYRLLRGRGAVAMARIICAFCLGVLVWLPAGLCRASEPVRVNLSWTRDASAEGCIDAEKLRTSVEQRLERPVFSDEAGELSVSGSLSGNPGSWRVLIEAQTSSGQKLGAREIRSEAEHCSALDESLVLVVALLVDVPREELPEPAPPPVREEPAPRSTVGSVRPTKLRVPRDAFSPREPWAFELGAAMSTSFGFLPGLGLGPQLSIGITPPRFWHFELSGTGWLEATDEQDGYGGRFNAWDATLRICPLDHRGKVQLRGCLEQRLSVVKAEGFGFDSDRTQDRLNASLGPRLGLLYPARGPVSIDAAGAVGIPFLRDRFVFRDPGGQQEIYERPLLTLVAELGLRLRL